MSERTGDISKVYLAFLSSATRIGRPPSRASQGKEELADLKWWLARKEEYQLELVDLEAHLADPEYADYQDLVKADIEHTRHILSLIDRRIASRAIKACVERIERSYRP